MERKISPFRIYKSAFNRKEKCKKTLKTEKEKPKERNQWLQLKGKIAFVL